MSLKFLGSSSPLSPINSSLRLAIASPADVLLAFHATLPSERPLKRAGKIFIPITAHFQIWEVHFGPCEMSRDSKKDQKVSSHTFKTNYSYELTHKFSY